MLISSNHPRLYLWKMIVNNGIIGYPIVLFNEFLFAKLILHKIIHCFWISKAKANSAIFMEFMFTRPFNNCEVTINKIFFIKINASLNFIASNDLSSNVGSVVEFSPATREARVRFPDVAF